MSSLVSPDLRSDRDEYNRMGRRDRERRDRDRYNRGWENELAGRSDPDREYYMSGNVLHSKARVFSENRLTGNV